MATRSAVPLKVVMSAAISIPAVCRNTLKAQALSFPLLHERATRRGGEGFCGERAL
jgi:hypothetical protein